MNVSLRNQTKRLEYYQRRADGGVNCINHGSAGCWNEIGWLVIRVSMSASMNDLRVGSYEIYFSH